MLSRRLPGEASPAAAGVLAPAIAPLGGVAQHFARAARDSYRDFVEEIGEATGGRVPCEMSGVLELSTDAAAAERRRHALGEDEAWLTPAELATLEPGVTNVAGAVLHERDGWVDNTTLLLALEQSVRSCPTVTVVDGLADELSLGTSPVTVRSASGESYHAEDVVLAAGAWTPWIRGLGRPLPVEPMRGQMLALPGRAIRHPIVAEHVYITPRPAETLVGSTLERVGLEVGTTPDALDAFRAGASALIPALAGLPTVRAWSGLRPMSPDLRPILGRHPDHEHLLLACGHSRNGVLLAPLTGECLARLVLGEEPEWDLAPFNLRRFT